MGDIDQLGPARSRRGFLKRAVIMLGAGVGIVAGSTTPAYASGSHCCAQDCSTTCPKGYVKAWCTTSCGSCCACIMAPFSGCKNFAGCFC